MEKKKCLNFSYEVFDFGWKKILNKIIMIIIIIIIINIYK